MATWLVVEDEEDIRNIVKIMFGAWGYSALEFRNGHETFEWLDKVDAGTCGDELPELALLDIKMPGPRGNEIANRIRKTKPIQEIPILLMTAFSLTEDERAAMFKDDGVDHIIAKPLPDFFELKRLIDEVRTKKKSKADQPDKTG